MLREISPIDKVSIVALAKIIHEEHGTKEISDLARKLDVPLMSEWRNRQQLAQRLSRPLSIDSLKNPEDAPDSTRNLAIFMISFLIQKAQAIQENSIRSSYMGWFKRLIIDSHERGYSYSKINELTGISIETLKGFKDACPIILEREALDEKTKVVMSVWQEASPWHRRTLDHFLIHFGRKQPSFRLSRDEMRQTLINLGFHTPRGPSIKNHGAQAKRPFAPHALWEGDGKTMKIRVNGEESKFTWYAFADQNTTLLVGSHIGRAESAETFLSSLRSSDHHTSNYPIGILIDNRLPDSNVSEVFSFCRRHGIVVVRTFPGNPKTNGIIEGNFSIFERFVGDINITGTTPDQIAYSIAETVVEIFTQLRNHSPRPALGGYSPEDFCKGHRRPEWARSAIERMARRFDRELLSGENKWQLIKSIHGYFGPLSWESEQKIKRELSKYPPLDIIAANARFLAQTAKYPENQYGAEYFLAILRHKRESIAKTIYSETYRAGIMGLGNFSELSLCKNEEICADRFVSEMIALSDLPSPSHQLMHLDAMAWSLSSYARKRSLVSLWKKIETLASRSIRLSLRWWSAITEYLSERLGEMLYSEGLSSITSENFAS